MYILVQSGITHAQSHLISYLMEILYNGHHCHWQCNGYRLYSHRKYTNSVTKVKGKMQFQDHCTCLTFFLSLHFPSSFSICATAVLQNIAQSIKFVQNFPRKAGLSIESVGAIMVPLKFMIAARSSAGILFGRRTVQIELSTNLCEVLTVHGEGL